MSNYDEATSVLDTLPRADLTCLHCGGPHETHEGDCCCHGHGEEDRQ